MTTLEAGKTTPPPAAWRGFHGTAWREAIDVAGFIRANHAPYEGNASFLAGPTERTRAVWERVSALFPEERRRGILDVDAATPSTITSHAPGYIDRDRELIVGLQTDAPLKRAIMPAGGLRMVEAGLAAYGYELDPQVRKVFTDHRKTHNAGVFDAYTPEILRARKAGVITGLPDAYGRGRIIGDYRRVALYGVDRLVETKRAEWDRLGDRPSTRDVIRDREELAEQVRALGELKRMAASYGFDVSGPARTAQEAVQWLYFGYLAAVKEQNGAAMSLGRTLVTRTSYRYLQTLYNLGPAPEPNLTVLWSPRLPGPFKRFCAMVSIDTSSVQYENDELIRPRFGDDTAIACCVSAMEVGRKMQFFGARVNLAKALLDAINGGRDEMTGLQVAPAQPPLTGDRLDFDEVMAAYDRTLDWLAATYVDALNIIHYMHDRYAYERIEMALHDHPVARTLACGIAGLSVAADSLSAIRHAGVRVIRDRTGLAVDYVVEGEYPAYGNNDDRADRIAVELVESFMTKIRRHPAHRDAEHTLSVLTITSNVVYGRHTGNTPDGRRSGEPFAPGANPMNGRDRHGLAAAALSVAKIPYDQARDGISLTESVTPAGLGRTGEERITNLAGVLDGFTDAGGFHMNVNVLDRATLLDAMAHPDRYPQLSVRVSGYAVNFVRLTAEQQRDVVNRTFHGSL